MNRTSLRLLSGLTAIQNECHHKMANNRLSKHRCFYKHTHTYASREYGHKGKGNTGTRQSPCRRTKLYNGTTWRYLVNITSRPLYPGKNRRYLLNKMLGRPHSQAGRVGVQIKRSLLLLGYESRTVQPVAQSQYRLSYPCSQKIQEVRNIRLYCSKPTHYRNSAP